ncbi:MAG: carboxypeptidase regulatory-like domain-containing protein [Candidatus Eisenbacteria bacterium]|nr:carboxypeptidase regulatory-like domain-containing protein [Candidatus Eisenbacteria bacterium]
MKAVLVLCRVALVAALTSLSILSSCAISSDLSGSVAGRVLAESTSQPISGAWVECEGVVSSSDELGYYSLDGINPGDRLITASASGFDDYAESVSIGESTQHDIYMHTDMGDARLYGHVTHSALGPIEGATVTLGDLSVTTDSDGFYEYDNIEQITYHMTVVKDSFRSFGATVRVTSEDFQYDVGLKKLATVTLEPIADAWVDEDQPGTNFGDDTELRLYFNNLFHYKFYVWVPVEIEDTAEAIDATLWLYNVWEEVEAEGRTILTSRVIVYWNEMDVNWNSMVEGTTGGEITSSSYATPWYEIDVTEYFRSWLAGSPNYGLQVDTPIEPGASRFYFASRESEVVERRPYVVLQYAW